MKLLLVEDEIELANATCRALAKHGVVTDLTGALSDAWDLVGSGRYDAIVVDRRLPDGEGLDFLQKLRRSGSDIPVIVLTARNMPQDRVEGLNFGADDYLGKPFLVEELLARLRAVLRRPPNVVEPTIVIGNLTIDALNLDVNIGSEPLEMPRRELLVLVALAKRRNRTVQRATLEDAVYNYDEEIQSNALDAHISRLRKRLSEAAAGVSIHNIRGVGYLLKEEA